MNTLSTGGDLIFITRENGGLIAYDINGKKLWENEEAGIVKFYSVPVRYENLIFLATIDRGIQIFDIRNGTLVDNIIPEKKEAIYNSPVVIDSTLIYFTERGNLISYNLLEKREVWKINIGDRLLLPPVINEDTLFIISKSRKKTCGNKH
ncbi:MAG: PQQ-binding-like beta-propeller repeat protein [Brevinematia bacterium]